MPVTTIKQKHKAEKKNMDLYVHTLHGCSWWLIQMEPRAADQIFAHMIYPALLKARVLRNIVCACSSAMVILQACFHTHPKPPEAREQK